MNEYSSDDAAVISVARFAEGDRVRVTGIPSLPDAVGVFSHEGRSAYGITLDGGGDILVKFGHLVREGQL